MCADVPTCECGDADCGNPVNVGRPCECDACTGEPLIELR